MIAIESYADGFRVTETEKRWTYFVYPNDNDIRNNGARYRLTEQIQARRLNLPVNWTLGDVVNSIIAAYEKEIAEVLDIDYGKPSTA